MAVAAAKARDAEIREQYKEFEWPSARGVSLTRVGALSPFILDWTIMAVVVSKGSLRRGSSISVRTAVAVAKPLLVDVAFVIVSLQFHVFT